MFIKDGEGNITCSDSEMKRRWREYFDKLFNIKNRRKDVEEMEKVETDGMKIDVGLHQGSALNPFLFILVLDVISLPNKTRLLTTSQRSLETRAVTPSSRKPARKHQFYNAGF